MTMRRTKRIIFIGGWGHKKMRKKCCCHQAAMPHTCYGYDMYRISAGDETMVKTIWTTEESAVRSRSQFVVSVRYNWPHKTPPPHGRCGGKFSWSLGRNLGPESYTSHRCGQSSISGDLGMQGKHALFAIVHSLPQGIDVEGSGISTITSYVY